MSSRDVKALALSKRSLKTKMSKSFTRKRTQIKDPVAERITVIRDIPILRTRIATKDNKVQNKRLR